MTPDQRRKDRLRIVLQIDAASKTVTCGGKPIDLAPDTRVDVGKGETMTLGDIVDSYAKAQKLSDVIKSFHATRQQLIGEFLFDAIGVGAFAGDVTRWLEIAIEDGNGNALDQRRFLERLPWSLLARPKSKATAFLAQDVAKGWVITIDGNPAGAKSEQLFPPEPRILLIISQDDTDSRGEEHLDDLLRTLRPFYVEETVFKTNVKQSQTWRETTQLINAFSPHVIYFYGHGSQDENGSSLRFDIDATSLDLPDVPASTIRLVIERQSPNNRPAVFIGNCCHGTSAARAGLGDELSDIVACVIANRTIVDVPMARRFGERVLEHLARDGTSPDEFMRDVVGHLFQTIGAAQYGGRWACPVVYTNYTHWTALAPERFPTRLKRATAGDFTQRLDRALPIDKAMAALKPVLASRDITLGALAWQADRSQGVESFGRRLRNAIYEQFTAQPVREYVVDLQADTRAAHHRPLRKHILASIFAALAHPTDPLLDDPTFEKLEKEHVVGLLKEHLSADGIVLLVRLGPVAINSVESQMLIQSYWRTWIDLRKLLDEQRTSTAALRIVLSIALDLAPSDKIDIASLLRPASGAPGDAVTDLGILSSVTVEDIETHLDKFLLFYADLFSDEIPQKAREIHALGQGGVFEPTLIILRTEANII